MSTGVAWFILYLFTCGSIGFIIFWMEESGFATRLAWGFVGFYCYSCIGLFLTFVFFLAYSAIKTVSS